jgi:hypothetical protein
MTEEQTAKDLEIEWLKQLKQVAESHQVGWLVDLENETDCLNWLENYSLTPEQAFYIEWPEFYEGDKP